MFVNTVHTHEVILENDGKIATKFEFARKNSMFGAKVTFEPEDGVVEVGKQKVISLIFESDIIGEFLEEFDCKIFVPFQLI